MPRNGSGVYSLPSGSIVTDGVDTIQASQHNGPLQDLEDDMNAVRPVVAGGTGANNASDARTNLGLGTMATQASSNVTITGGAISGITDLAVADGGTGASNAAGARTNLGAVGLTGNESISGTKTFANDIIVGTFDLAFASSSGITLDAVGTDNNGVVRVKTFATTSDGSPIIVGYQGQAERFLVTADGDVTNKNNSYGAISDERLKKDIAPATQQLSDLRQIEVVKYRPHDAADDAPLQIGVIAQQVLGVKPGLVKTGADGMHSVKYSVLNVLLLKALQELADKVDELEARLNP